MVEFCSAIDKEYAAGAFTGSVFSYFRVTKPLLEILQRDDLAVAFFLFFPCPLAPRIKLLVGDASSLDPREALFVLLAVRLENRVIGLFFRPLPERADLAAALLAVLHGALAILCAHTAGLREPAAAIFAAAHGHAALDAASQRIVDHVAHGGGIQNRRAATRFDRLKAQRDRLKSEQLRISRLVVMIVFRRLFLRLTTGGIYVQHTFQKLLALLPCL